MSDNELLQAILLQLQLNGESETSGSLALAEMVSFQVGHSGALFGLVCLVIILLTWAIVWGTRK
jgi:hypothetical protein